MPWQHVLFLLIWFQSRISQSHILVFGWCILVCKFLTGYNNIPFKSMARISCFIFCSENTFSIFQHSVRYTYYKSDPGRIPLFFDLWQNEDADQCLPGGQREWETNWPKYNFFSFCLQSYSILRLEHLLKQQHILFGKEPSGSVRIHAHKCFKELFEGRKTAIWSFSKRWSQLSKATAPIDGWQSSLCSGWTKP